MPVFRDLFVCNTLQIDDRNNRSSATLDQTPLKCESLAGGVVDERDLPAFTTTTTEVQKSSESFFSAKKFHFEENNFFWCVAKILIIKQNFSLSASHSEQLQKLLRYLPRERVGKCS